MIKGKKSSNNTNYVVMNKIFYINSCMAYAYNNKTHMWIDSTYLKVLYMVVGSRVLNIYHPLSMYSSIIHHNELITKCKLRDDVEEIRWSKTKL